jgi:hypothetical protein
MRHSILTFLSRVKIDLREIEHLVNKLKNEKDELKGFHNNAIIDKL